MLTCFFTAVHCFNFRTTAVIHQGRRTLVSGHSRSWQWKKSPSDVWIFSGPCLAASRPTRNSSISRNGGRGTLNIMTCSPLFGLPWRNLNELLDKHRCKFVTLLKQHKNLLTKICTNLEELNEHKKIFCSSIALSSTSLSSSSTLLL